MSPIHQSQFANTNFSIVWDTLTLRDAKLLAVDKVKPQRHAGSMISTMTILAQAAFNRSERGHEDFSY